MLNINYNESTITFVFENTTNSYPFDNISINGEEVSVNRISNKEKSGNKFFIVRDVYFHFIINNNLIYGVHYLLGSFSGELNETIYFSPFEEIVEHDLCDIE